MAEQRGNIAQFNAGEGPALNLSIASEAASNLSQSAWREGQLYKQAGADYIQAGKEVGAVIDQHETMSEVSQGSAALAAMHNNLTTQWNKLASQSDPNDTTIQGKFLNDTVEPALQQWQNGFTTAKGQNWALAQADQMRTHYYETTAADVSTRAGEARVSNAVTQLNQLSNAAYNDPRSVDLSMKQVDGVYAAAVENSQGLLSTKQIDQIGGIVSDAKNELIKSAVKGFADSDDPQGPAKARAVLDSGKFDSLLSPEEKTTMRKYIDNQDTARQTEKQQKEQADQWKQTQANAQEVKGVFSQLASGQGYPATTAFANQKLTTQQRNDLVAQRNGILSLPQEFLTSPAYGDSFGQVSKAVYNGQPMTAEALTLGVRRQEITPAGAVQLQELSDKMKTPEGMAEMNAQKQVLAQMQSQIVKGGQFASDPAGQKLYNDMLNSFYPAWNAAIKAGKSPADLADPNSKDYIGNLANTFKRNDAQALADVTRATPPAVPPKPTEKDIEFLKANPAMAVKFDKTFGGGSAAKLLRTDEEGGE